MIHLDMVHQLLMQVTVPIRSEKKKVKNYWQLIKAACDATSLFNRKTPKIFDYLQLTRN